MPIQRILVRKNPEANFTSWMCEHVAPQIPEKEGELILCENCSDLLDAGADAVDEENGKGILPGPGDVEPPT